MKQKPSVFDKTGLLSAEECAALVESFRKIFAAGNDRQRVVVAEINDAKYWAKRAVPSKIKIWHFLQKIASKMVPLPIFKPTVSGGGANDLYEEYERIRHFGHAGFLVPELICFAEDLFVMVDAGPSLKQVVEEADATGRKVAALCGGAKALARLHQAGLCHGRPHIRDMFVSANGKPGFLDLEENPVKVMPVVTAQARDAWIFIASIIKFVPNEIDQREVLAAYLKESPPTVSQELSGLVKYAWPIGRFLEFLPFSFGVDLRRVLCAGKLFRHNL